MKLCLQCKKSFDNLSWQCPHCNYIPRTSAGYLSLRAAKSSQSSGFDPHLYDALFNVEADNFWFTSRNSMIIHALETFFPQASSFLEIGCGTGFVLSAIQKAFPELKVAGGDYFTEALEYSSRRVQRAQLFQIDARQIPFENHFDVIGMFDVL